MLLPEERYVVHWLSQYGALPLKMLHALLQKPEDVSAAVIRNLKRMGRIANIQGGYYLGLDPLCEPDQRTILALWVLARYLDRVAPLDHYPAEYPGQVGFLKNNTVYEIVVLYQGEESRTRLLQAGKETKYILAVPEIKMVKHLFLPEAPCLFVTVQYQKNADEPSVTFYPEEAILHGE